MLKANYYSLFLLSALFLNSAIVLRGSSLQSNDSLLSSVESEQSLFSSIYQHTNPCCLFPIDSTITPDPYNWNFNSSTNTFIPPFMYSDWYDNNATNIFNTNDTSLPIEHVSNDFNHTFVHTKSSPLSIPDESISCNSTHIPVHTNNSSIPFVEHPKQEAEKEEGKDRVLTVKKEKKREKLQKNKSKKKTFTCLTCKKSLASQQALIYHKKTHIPNRARPYHCHLCNKSFTGKYILSAHIERHNNEKPFKCDFCSKRFVKKFEKTRHHRIHTGDKLFTCNICKKGLSTKIVLEGHLNKHKGKKPYQCNKCAKAYTSSNGLKRHMKTHNRPKPYTCHYCDASFVLKSKYKNHVLYEEETDEERKCHHCEKVFSDKYHLRRHNKRAHPRINS